MATDKIISSMVPLVGFTVLASGVCGIVKEKPYAIERTSIAVAGLGYYYARRWESFYRKTGRLLNEMFPETVSVSKGCVFYYDKKSVFLKTLLGKRAMGQQCCISSSDFDLYIKGNLEAFFCEVISFAITRNIMEGKSIKSAVLNGVADAIRQHSPEFYENNSVRFFLNEQRVLDIYALKMCNEIYQNVNACQNEEAVLEYLKTGFLDKTSPFYGVVDENRLKSFLNRGSYEQGKEVFFKALNVTQYVSLSGALATQMVSGFVSNPIAVTATAGLAGGVFLFNQLQREKHLKSQLSRFGVSGFELKSTSVERFETLETEKYVGWYEKTTGLTKLKRAKLNVKMMQDVLCFAKKSSFASVKEFLTSVRQQIFANKNLMASYRAIEDGATLESAADKYGLENVYQMLWLSKYADYLTQNTERPIHSLIFELENNICDEQKAVALARKKMTRRAYNETQAILELYMAGFISQENKTERLCRVFDYEDKGSWYFVPERAKLPKKIQKSVRALSQMQREYDE